MQTGRHTRGFIRNTRAAVVALLLVWALADANAGEPADIEFDIPAGKLADSLDRFGEQSGLQVVYDYASVAGVSATAVVGVMPATAVLARFLHDSGLAWTFVNDATVVVRRAPPPSERAPRRGRERQEPTPSGVLTGLTVVASPHRELPQGTSGASFGFDKSLVATPRSVSSVNVATIDTLGLSAVEDLIRVVPGVYTTTRWGIQGSIDVRAVPADTYFRGMKRLSLQGHGRSVLAAMEKIEVVRGPPSPISGMGKIGGYTNTVPRSSRAASGGYLPSPQGFVQAVSGSYDKSEVSFGVGGPLPRDTSPAGYYVYGLFENSGSFVEQVPIEQQVLQAAVNYDDLSGDLRLEAGANWQRSGTAGALLGRFTQDVADTGRYIRGAPLVDLDANGNGRIGYLEMYEGSPVHGDVSNGNQALRQIWDWPKAVDGSYLPLAEFPVVAGIPQSLYDYLVAHPEADPTGLLRAAGPGGPQPASGYIPAGFALDPRTVTYDQLDLRRPGAFERDLQADFVTVYVDLIDDADPNRTFKNQLFFDSMDQYKISEQPFSQQQDVNVVEDRVTFSRRIGSKSRALDVNALFSANVRYTTSEGLTASGDYATHRADAMSNLPAASPGATFATAGLNADLLDDGQPWTASYSSDSLEVGAGVLFDLTLHEKNNLVLGLRVDESRVANTDFAGTLDLAAGTANAPAVFRSADERATGRDTGGSWSVSWSRRLPRGLRPYVTLAEASVALDENNNKYDNGVIAAGHVGGARLNEIGVKGSLADDRLFFATALYEQSRVGVGPEDAPSVLAAYASATETQGWEGELKWGPLKNLFFSLYALRQTTRFRPNSGANIMVDARALGFRDVVDAAGNVVYPAEAFLYGGRSFLRLPPELAAYEEKQGNPETQLGMFAEYELRPGCGFTVNANYFSSVSAGRLQLVELPSASVVNVGVFWELNGWRFKYDMLNAFDARYFRARTGDTLADPLVSAMPGRRSQLTVRVAF